MSQLDSMLQRNKEFAARESSSGGLPPAMAQAMPNVRAIIIGCADMRVDPAHLLGIKLGEAVVIRNIGGGVTPDLLEQLGLLGKIGAAVKEIPGGGGGFYVVVMHPTHCGMTRLAGDAGALAHCFQISEGEVQQKAAGDPRAAVAVDVAALRAVPALPGQWLLSGVGYDVANGVVG